MNIPSFKMFSFEETDDTTLVSGVTAKFNAFNDGTSNNVTMKLYEVGELNGKSEELNSSDYGTDEAFIARMQEVLGTEGTN